MAAPAPVVINGQSIPAGRRARVEISLARLPSGEPLPLEVEVIHGARPGPSLWLSAGIHGDEVGGVVIVGRCAQRLRPQQLSGTVYAVPLLNGFGFASDSRYLPDRRDLNRSFPGSARGSLASRIAHTFVTEIVARCDYGLDFHTGASFNYNLPQVRGNLEAPQVRAMAQAFAPPVIIDSPLRGGSLRQAAGRLGKHVLLFEGGEASRLAEPVLDAGVSGALRVMVSLGMLDEAQAEAAPADPPLMVHRSAWVRAPRSGLVRLAVNTGDRVTARQALGTIADAFGDKPRIVRAPRGGTVIALSRRAMVHQGDALVHIGEGTSEPRGHPPA